LVLIKLSHTLKFSNTNRNSGVIAWLAINRWQAIS
jgi:hypothetical protein